MMNCPHHLSTEQWLMPFRGDEGCFFWTWETKPVPISLDLPFVVTQVPAPDELALLGLAGFASKRR
jgi:hypothetical protein